MEDLIIQAMIGLLAGLLGGLLGLGGSTVVIPALIVYLTHIGAYDGSKQHLLQAAAMICNVFIAAPSTVAHLRAKAVVRPVVVYLVPAAVGGSLLGVTVSNSFLFAREKGPYLAMLLAGFFLFVAVHNLIRFFRPAFGPGESEDVPTPPVWKILLVGLPTGFTAGLLGIGGGTICVPTQQLFLKIPLRKAIANSAVTIVFGALIGAIYKNATLASHGEAIWESLRLAAMLVPTAIIGSYVGGWLTHRLSRPLLRVIFVGFMITVAYLTFTNAWKAVPGAVRAKEEVKAHLDKTDENQNESGLDGSLPSSTGPVEAG
ncbi:MAG: sulfite exporter TauE/SafE family protein [Pirellulales bacterium]|nr:sulfite exporter TauE/SafE family protein [Pirellulales bacterium]